MIYFIDCIIFMPKFAEQNKNNYLQKGVALYLALAILSILLAISLGVAAIVFGQMRTLTSIGFSTISFYAADTGMEEELFNKNYLSQGAGYTYFGYLNLDIDGTSGGSSCPGGLNDPDDACYKVTLVSISPLVIRSAGFYKDVQRALEVSF
ncbi:MAG: hypothetical protein A2667_01835 [Candidatus Wildermuthbacteria bacterium RIFCSPHIGHO2_01_FULL_47_27]|uniref:Type 4 fimbrial biogenesis protein PilX N-terminal domain-containing protein n=2 Tax=Candidatus Wildermuthiibacteriota TaxID=1817923 RepID=A0A1G2RTY3_9BACT|nr:MAG: hypothetical protein UY15_C0006G0011 [Parcubacteria group bacterium GW2011_GWA2_47_9]OHA63790.1 MAG: hypothetical protein A2667_01835 [Candidatus Wildermuthbacteria bacterium RIFCSPHIGHO2_01_FULL_47_27]OHA68928.1 MAG: hypothetical protein A3D59_00525 [Candidatus Wildermuthbacteria bacterium RIFCSPHIGHO2_02_FULL_47_17]OHA75531.1 MAG: hypothetical protein A3A32_00585 [Candidatus Wildermuthbacteria bacterium RIFCSPLOWO2_01_FULL_48_35]